MGNTPPLELKQEEKAKLCLKSGRFDPPDFHPFPKEASKAVRTEATPLPGMNTIRWRLIFKTLDYDDASDYYQGTREILLCGGQWYNHSVQIILVLWNRMPLVKVFLQLKSLKRKGDTQRCGTKTHSDTYTHHTGRGQLSVRFSLAKLSLFQRLKDSTHQVMKWSTLW